ncbi:glycosyltransferase [Flavobacterium pedocola]
MQKSPLVTVICLCYNHADFVVETLNSVLNQSYPDIELIVGDDFSTDNSVEVIENWLSEHPEVLFIKNDKNLGNTKTFNKAFQYAKGDFLIDLAADDILLPDCISIQIDTFKNSRLPNLGVVYGNVENIQEDGRFDSFYYPTDSQRKVIEKRTSGDVYKEVLSGETMCSVSSMTKRSVFEQLGGYDEKLAYEDFDFWVRASRSYDFEFIDAVVVQKRITKTAMTKDFHRKSDKRARKMNYSTFLILKKALDLNKTKEENKALLKRIHYEISLNLKTKNYWLLVKLLLLKLKAQLK